MKCVLIFDYTNDIIYAKYNKKFALHINELAKTQGLLPQEVSHLLVEFPKEKLLLSSATLLTN